MGKRLVQMARGVQHVGRDDQVVGVGVEALVDRVLLDVQNPEVDRGAVRAETRLRVGEEAGGDVGIHEVEPSGRKLRQEAFGRRADAGAHLQHAQPPPVRQFVHQRPDHLADHPVRRPPDRRQPIQIAGRRFRVAEQQRQRVLVAAEHLRKGARAAPEQPDLVRRVRESLGHLGQIPLGIARQFVRQRFASPDRYREAFVLRLQHARTGQNFQHPAKQMRMLGQNLEALAQLLRVHGSARPALPPQRFQGRERIAPRRPFHFPLQVDFVRDLDSLIGQIPGERLRAGRRGRRAREEVGRQHARRQGAVAPCDLVEQFLDPFHGGEQRGSRRTLHRVSPQGPDRGSVEVAEGDVRGHHLRQFAVRAARPAPRAHVAEQPVR